MARGLGGIPSAVKWNVRAGSTSRVPFRKEQIKNIFLAGHGAACDLVRMARGSRIVSADEFSKPWDAVSFGDLREWHAMYARCRLCDRRGELNDRQFLRRFGRSGLLVHAQAKLACSQCRNNVGNRIEVERLPRNL